jgi:hypothetical protein
MRRLVVAICILLFPSAASAQDEEPQPPAEPPAEEPPPVEPPPPLERPAPEPPRRPARFGSAGQVVITGAWVMGVGYDGRDDSSITNFVVNVSPSIDFFPATGLSIGGEIDFVYSARKSPILLGGTVEEFEQKTLLFGLGPRIGYAIAFSDHVSLWPQVGCGLAYVSVTQKQPSASPTTFATPFQTNDRSSTIEWISMYAPLLFHPAPNFFIGIGPSFYYQFEDAGSAPEQLAHTTVGARAVVGGYWGGESSKQEPTASPRPVERFGSAGQLVVTSESGASIAHTSAIKGGGTTTTVTLVPGLDWFVVDHFSVGASFELATNSSAVVDRTIAFGPRLGADIPFSASFSLFPRAMFLFGDEHASDTSSALVSVDLFAPLLFHATDHLFVGFGPYVERDLKRRAGNHTQVGGSLVIGGWF